MLLVFDHKNFAVDGLYPGLVTTRSIAVLGVFDIEVIIEPIRPSLGGGGYVPNSKIDKYKVTIRVSMKSGKVWNYSKVVSNTMARVVAKSLGVKLEEKPIITIHSVRTSNPETDIKVHKK